MLVLDAGAFFAVERGDRDVVALIKRERRAGRASAGSPEVLVLDAGAFVAVERGDRGVVALIKRERLAGRAPLSHGGVVAQVWRGGTGRQAPVDRLLAGVDIAALDEFVAAFEAEHGEITEAEMSEAARRARGRAVVVRGEPAPGQTGGPGERGVA